MHLKRDTCYRIGSEIIESRGTSFQDQVIAFRLTYWMYKLYEDIFLIFLIQVNKLIELIGLYDLEKKNINSLERT